MKSSIRAKLFLLVFGAIFFGGATVGVSLLGDYWRAALIAIEGEIHNTAKLVAANVTDDLYFRNLAGLRRELDHLKANPQIEMARLLAWDGENLVEVAGSGNDADNTVSTFFSQAVASREWRSRRIGDGIEAVMPIEMRNGQRLGALHVVASLNRQLALRRQTLLRSLGITLLHLLAAALLVWVLTRQLLTDICLIADTAASIGAGNLTARVTLQRRDEIAALGESINRMAQALRQSELARVSANAELFSLTSELEATVSSRTAALTARNEELASEIARRKTIEESLRRTDARHRAVVEIAPDAVVTTDEQGIIVEFNRVAETIFGHHRRDALGKPMADILIPAEFRAGYQAGFALIAGGNDTLRGKRIEIVAMRAGGARFPVEFAIVAVDAPEGRLLTAFMRDISERKQQEKALHDAEQKLRELVETAQAIIWETDALTWKYSFVSQGAEAILGYPVQRWLSEAHFWPMTIHKDDRAMVLKSSRENTRAGLDHELEYRALTADGRVIWLKDIVRVIKNPEGKVIGLRGIKIEITSRKHVEESLRESVSGMMFVQRISRKLLVADNVNLALDEILRECVVHGNFDFGTILMVDAEGKSVRPLASYGYRDPRSISRDSRVNEAAQGRYRSISLQGAHVQEDIQAGDRLRTLKREGAQRALFVPIGVGERNLGFFQLATRRHRPIEPRLLPLMETVGQQIGMSIQKARLLEETQRSLKRQAALHEINLAVNSTLDLDQVLDQLLNHIESLLSYRTMSTIRLLDPVTNTLELRFTRSLPSAEVKEFLQRQPQPFSQVVWADQAPVWVADVSGDPRCPDPAAYRRYSFVSYLGAPLLVKGEAIGVLSLIGLEKRTVTEEEIEFISLVAGQAAMAIHNADLFGNLQKQTAELISAREIEVRSRADSELLATISQEILAAGENDTWCEKVLGQISQATNFDLATILLLENDGQSRRAVASYGYRNASHRQRLTGQGRDAGESLPGALEYDAPIVWNQLQQSDRLRTLREEGALVALSVPVKWTDRSMGILQLASRSKSAVEQREIELFEAIAKQIAIGLQKAQLLEKTRQDLQRRQMLHEVNLAVTSTLELTEVGDRLLTTLVKHLPFAFRMAVRLIDPDTGRVLLISSRGIQGQSRDLFDLLAKEVVARRDVFMVRDLTEDLRVPHRDRFAKRGAKSYLGVPLLIHDQCLGVLSVTTGETKLFSAEEVDMFRLVAGQAAVAIQNAQRYQDIHAQKAAIEKAKEIEAAAAAKSRFLAMMSHEIRTPLNAVIGMTELMLRSPLSDDQRQLAETIKQSGSGLLSVINDILDFSKIEADKIAVELVETDLFEILHGVVKIMSGQAMAKGLVLTLKLAPEVPQMIVADAGRIRQILLNLISNAVKFTAAGEISIAVEVASANNDGMEIQLSVTDEGIGIPSEAQARLFQPFSQADTSTTRKYGGTGLGLAISKRLADLMGSGLQMRSQEGKGSTFWFTVFTPLIAQPAAELQPRGNGPAVDERSKLDSAMRILLVEDNPVNQMVALRLLELLGLHADVANDGAEAIDVAQWQDYDLLLMDCEMPNLDGYQATAAIRRREADSGRRARIIAMTANAMAGDREKCLAAGMDDYVAKPIVLESLRAALQRCL